jgi:predicted XRE-type DNA-binding protein
MTKQCCKCKIVKNLSCFHKHKSTKDGLQKTCKECRQSYWRSSHYHFKKMYYDTVDRTKKRLSYMEKLHTLTWQEFQFFKPAYNKLHKIWVKNNYKRSLTPSADRIDNSRGYHFDNIQIITTGENARKDQLGENHQNAKLTSKQVIEIRAKYKPRIYTQKQLAEEYGITRQSITDIISRRNWKHI